MDRESLNDAVTQIANAAHRVSRRLGIGFLEKVYENALVWELRKTGLPIHQQAPMRVTYEGHVIGDYVADVLVADQVVVEIKAATAIVTAHRLQTLNYLRASDLRIGVILNFGNPRLEIARVVNRF